MQQGTHKGSVLDVPSGTELFPVLESTQKFTADGVAHSSIPALRSNDEATGCSLLLLPFSLPISRVPPFFSCRLVASSRRESNHHPLSSPIPRYSNTKRSKKESRHFLASPERKSFYLVSVNIYIYTFISLRTVGKIYATGSSGNRWLFPFNQGFINAYGHVDRFRPIKWDAY